MLRRLREDGPVVLVPLAWSFVTVAHLDLVSQRTLLVAHVVMASIMVAFAVLSWRDMSEGVLRVWWTVVAVGAVLTSLGAVGLALSPPSVALLWVTVVGWMLLPAVGFWYTARTVAAGRFVNLAAAVCSVLAALAYVTAGLTALLPFEAALAVVGLGQTAGIVDAVVRY